MQFSKDKPLIKVREYVKSSEAGVLGDMYRASTSVHRGLAEGLADGEGHVRRANAGGGLDGQVVSLLGDFDYRAGGGRHGDLPEENVHT